MSAAEQPAALRIASMFDSMRRVCASRASSSFPVSGSRPVCAVTKTRSPVRIAFEYVPRVGGAASVLILVLLTIRREPFCPQRYFKVHFHWSTAQRREIQQLHLSRKNDLQQHDVFRIGK